MIINEWDINRGLYFVRDLDTDRNMFIGTMDECKQFQIDYNKAKAILGLFAVSGQSEQLNTDLENEVFNNNKDWATNEDVDEHFRSV